MVKMRKKRDRLEVIFDFLKIIQDNHNSIKPTPLLRKTNLSSQSFSEYFEELINKNLIREIIDKKGKKFITLTDTGFKYLQKYKVCLYDFCMVSGRNKHRYQYLPLFLRHTCKHQPEHQSLQKHLPGQVLLID